MIKKRIILSSTLGTLRRKLSDKKIVLGSGCFDIIHSGHLYFLEEARSQGDVLVVGINSDQAIKKIKGPTRPIINEEERSKLLVSLRNVDYVFIFDNRVINEELLLLKPDTFAIGAESALAYPEEVAVAREVGAKIHLIHRIPSDSTTSIINNISLNREV